MARSMLLDLLQQHSGARLLQSTKRPGFVSSDQPVFPFLAVVGQTEMKTALLLNVINPAVGGVLLIGPRGTGKTTAVRGLLDLLPDVEQSNCPYGCEEEAAEIWGIDALCPDCAVKMASGEPLTSRDRMRLIELPLNARLEDVIGGVNERVAVEQHKVQLQRGILAFAHRNLLYVDEVNLLDDLIVDAILDAAAQRRVIVRRGPLSINYPSDFILVGSMNPEEGCLRPQIQDRFGLRVVIDGLEKEAQRLEVYRRVRRFREHPHWLAAALAEETAEFRDEIQEARRRLAQTELSSEAEQLVLTMVRELRISSHRAEMSTLEAARAHAAADDRVVATAQDVRAVAPMALRQRQSPFMEQYLATAQAEDKTIAAAYKAAAGSGGDGSQSTKEKSN